MKTSFFASCVLLISLAATQATLLFSDTFTYPDGALTNVSGGIWVEDNSGGALLATNSQAQISRSLTEQVHASLGQTNSTGSGIVLYCGFTINMGSGSALPAAGGGYFLDYGTGSQRCKVFSTSSGAAAGYYRLNIGNGTSTLSATSQYTNDLTPNTSYTVVTRYDVDSGVSTMWINPTAETDPSVTATDTASPTTISSIHLRQAGSMGIMLIDNLKVGTTFADAIGSGTLAPAFTTEPAAQGVTVGQNATFSVVATGLPTPTYQWQFYSTNIVNATNATLTLTNVQLSQAGPYSVIASNSVNATNSDPATLTVYPVQQTNFTVLTYNTAGDTATDWSTNAPQVQAIGRELMYLHPDILTLNEIPMTNTYQMANWVTAYLPGYYLATNSAPDGFIRNAILSRYPITRSTSYLHSSSLTNYDATVTNGFTRDLFEAQINVPGIPRPLHVFVVHLKSTDAAKRAAEACAVSNYIANVFLATNTTDPYLLAGDMNEDINRPGFTNQPIQNLVNAATGLQLTTPVNPYNGDDRTWSIQASSPTVRFDYIMPCPALFSNITSSQVFRTDLLSPLPSGLNATDDSTASDHLPVLMTFANPYASTGFRVTSLTRNNQTVTLKWESTSNQTYRVEASTNLAAWTALTTNFLAADTNATFATNLSGNINFFRVGR